MRTTKKEKIEHFNGAYALKITRVKEDDFPYHGQTLSCTQDVVDFAKYLQSADNEKFIALYLDAQNKLICLQVTEGIVNQAVVYPRAIIRHALIVNASGMILIHNHPSGVVRPSEADIRLTRTIKEIADKLEIIIHDHFIIAGNSDRYFSFREDGLLF